MDYLLLLRGINVGGKHRVTMADLRDYLTAAGFTYVHSYINSGNLLVTSNQPQADCETTVQQVLASHFDFPLPFRLLAQPEFLADLAQAPEWWGANKQLRHNALFKLNDYDSANDTWLVWTIVGRIPIPNPFVCICC